MAKDLKYFSDFCDVEGRNISLKIFGESTTNKNNDTINPYPKNWIGEYAYQNNLLDSSFGYHLTPASNMPTNNLVEFYEFENNLDGDIGGLSTQFSLFSGTSNTSFPDGSMGKYMFETLSTGNPLWRTPNNSLSFLSGGIGMSVWIKKPSNWPPTGLLSNNYIHDFRIYNGLILRFTFDSTNSSIDLLAEPFIGDALTFSIDVSLWENSEWSHLVYNRVNNLCQLYLDNNIILNEITNDDFLSGLFTGEIKSTNLSTLNDFGWDQLRFYNGAISSNDVSILYSEKDNYIPEEDFIIGPQDIAVKATNYLENNTQWYNFGPNGLNTDLSFSTWIKSVDNSINIIKESGNEIILSIDLNGKINFIVKSTPSFNITSSQSVNDGLWHHIVGNFEEKGAPGYRVQSIYIDKVEDVSITTNFPTPDTAGTLQIGDKDKILDLARTRIYASGLSKININDLYNELIPIQPADWTSLWTLSGNLNDSSTVSPNNMQMDIGNELYYFDDEKGDVFNFDGASTIETLQPVQDGAKSGVSFWVNTNSTIGGTMASNWNTSGGTFAERFWNIFMNSNGTIQCLLGNDLSSTYVLNGSNDILINDGSWHNVILTWDYNGDKAYLYIDGILNATTYIDGNPSLGLQSWKFGSKWDNIEYWTGHMNNIYFYGDTISSLEAVGFYNDKNVGAEKMLLLDPGVIVDMPAKKNFDPIMGTGIKIYAQSPSKFYYENLFDVDSPPNTVELSIDGSLYFEGSIIPEVYEENMSPYNKSVTIPANDGLGSLDNYRPNFKAAYNSTANDPSLLYIIKDILNSTGFERDIMINSTLFETNHTSDDTHTLYDQTYLYYLNTINKDSDSLTGKDILSGILNSFNSRIYKDASTWFIDRYEDLGGDNSNREYKLYTGNNYTATRVDVSTNVIDVLSDFSIIADSNSIKRTNGVKTFELKYEINKFDNLTHNYNADYRRASSILSGANISSNNFYSNDQNFRTWLYHDTINDTGARPFQYRTLSGDEIFFSVDINNWQWNSDGIYTMVQFGYDSNAYNIDTQNSQKVKVSFDALPNRYSTANSGAGDIILYVRMVARVENTAGASFYMYKDADDVWQKSSTIQSTVAEIKYTTVFDGVNWQVKDWDTRNVSWNIDFFNAHSSMAPENKLIIGISPICETDLATPLPNMSFYNFRIQPEVYKKDNIIIGDISTNFRKSYNGKMMYSDITNPNYFGGYELQSLKRTSEWNDANDASLYSLQNKFIKGRIVPLSVPVYSYKVQCANVDPIKHGMMFKDSCIDPSIVYQLNGVRYNVKYATADLTLNQWVDYKNIPYTSEEKRIFELDEVYASDTGRVRRTD